MQTVGLGTAGPLPPGLRAGPPAGPVTAAATGRSESRSRRQLQVEVALARRRGSLSPNQAPGHLESYPPGKLASENVTVYMASPS